MKPAIAFVAIVFAASAHAQYRCEGPGGVSYQQTPCPAAATETRIGPAPKADAPRWISPDRPESIRKAFAEGRVVPGMFFSEVYALAGRAPDATNTLATRAGTREQLVYRMPHRTVFVYVEGDVVTAVQVAER